MTTLPADEASRRLRAEQFAASALSEVANREASHERQYGERTGRPIGTLRVATHDGRVHVSIRGEEVALTPAEALTFADLVTTHAAESGG